MLLLNRLSFGGRPEAAAAVLDPQFTVCEIIERIRAENLWGRAEALQALEKTWDPEREIDAACRQGCHLLPLWDPAYPLLLKQIVDPPLVLYYKGSLVSADDVALAVVGARHPSLYGLQQTARFVRALSERGMTIVSGFAVGIDRAAHEASLTCSYGRTLAVLGCGLDVSYPKKNQDLTERICERGALISEYALGTPPRGENFPRRNRIISGLSLGTLVVEAHWRSGSLITAHEAIDQGREVFAVPGSVDQLTSSGTHRLIREGATLVTSPDEVFEGLALPAENIRRRLAPFSGQMEFPCEIAASGKENQKCQPDIRQKNDESMILKHLRSGGLPADDLIRALNQPSYQVALQLTELEMAGRIRRMHDGTYQIINHP